MTLSLASVSRTFDLLDIPITLLDIEGRIQHLNPANERLLGRTVDELRGQPIGAILPDALRERSAGLLASLLERGTLREVFPNERPDGTVVQVEVTAEVVRLREGEPRWILATVRDLGPEIARLERLNASVLGLLTAPGDDLLAEIVQVARALLGARYAALGVIEAGALVRFIPDGLTGTEIAGIAHWPEGKGLLGAMVTERRTIRTPEILSDPRSSGFPAGHPPMRSFLGTPIQTADAVYGHLYFTEKLGSAEFSFIDERLAELFASHAAIAIRDARRRGEVMASEAALAEAQRMARIGSGEFDIAADRLRWSAEALRIFGAPAERVATLSDFLALVHPDDRAAVQADTDATVESGRPLEMRHRIVRGDGTVRMLASRAELVRDEVGVPARLVGTVQDITELTDTAERLRESERNLAEAQRIAHIGSWERNLTTGALSWSDESYRIVGIEPGTFDGTVETFLGFVHPDDRATAAPSREALAQRGPTEIRYRIIRPDGTVRTLREVGDVIRDADGGPIRFVGTTQDITELVAAEAQQTRLARLLDEVASEIYIFNAESLRFAAMNAGALGNIGYSIDELRELTPLDLKPEFTRASFEMLLAPLRTGERAQIAFETIHRRKDGSTYPVEMRLHFLPNETPAVFVAIIQDITERKRLEAQLRQSQRLEAVGQLAGGIAHDFNNILTAIRGFTELVLRNLAPDDANRPDLDHVVGAADQAANLVRQLLAFSRRQILLPRVLDPGEVIEGIAPLLRRLLGEDVELSVLPEPGLGHISVDPGQLEQVIVNLAVNARDAMPTGGKLTIEAANVDLDAAHAASHPGASSGSHVLIAVSDTGAGMDPEIQAHAFEPFFTTKGPDKGTGMGLATVYGIVKQSGGSIYLYSEPGRGTTFKIYIPRAHVQAWASAGAVDEPTAPMSGSETILLVEDDESVRAYARRVLEASGFTVLEAPGGPDALALATGYAGMIDLLLTDVIMPGMHGIELADRLVAERPGLRVLYVSGFTENSVIQHGVAESGVAFHSKPYGREDLVRAVRAVLDAAQ
ncbi:MAG: PAS domain S-box protein [Chloroflexota bacterium]